MTYTMKRSSLFAVFRSFLVLSVFAGLWLVLFHFLSFETITNLLNRLAPDGEFASFTFERYQILSRLSGLLGLVLTIFAGAMLIKWSDTQKRIDNLLTQIQDFNGPFRSDARAFLSGLSFTRWNRADLMLLSGLVFVALITRLASLNIPLTHDEAYTYNAFASRSLWQTISDYHLPNNHVLLSIILNIITHLFGHPLWLIRLPTIVAGVLMVPVGYVLGKRLYSREAGILSAALIAVFPILVTYSVLARGYAFLSLITLMILILGDYVRENKNRLAWLLLIITSALGFFTVPIMLFPFGALYVWLFLSWLFGDFSGYRSKFDFLKYWLASGFASAFLIVLLYTPILINNYYRFVGNGAIVPLGWDLFPTIIWVRVRNTWMEWVDTIPGWIVILGVIGLIIGLILDLKISKRKVPQQFAFLVWIVTCLVARRPDMMPRMWLFLAAPLLIWSAGGIIEPLKLLSDVLKNKLPLARIFLGIVLVSIFLLGILTIPTIPDRWKQKSSVESAAIYLKDHLREGDLATASREYFPQLRYYFGIYAIPQKYLRHSGPFQRAFMVVGEGGRATLESVVSNNGPDHSAVDLNTIRIVLQFDDLVIYEGYPVP